MKNRMSQAIAITAILGSLCTAAQAVHRKDVLECMLPGGRTATLTAAYDWSPLAEVIPADVSKRLNQEPWQIRFNAAHGLAGQQPPRTIPYAARGNPCSHIGVVDGTLVACGTFLERSGSWFDSARLPSKLMLHPATKTQSPLVREQLQAIGATPVLSYSILAPRNGQLVFERPLVKAEGNSEKVIAVFQSISTDGGASWSDPSITRQAQIFSLDQPPFGQPFQGRAVSLNGKAVP